MASATIFKGFNIPIEDRSLISITKDIQEGKYKNEVEEVRALFAQGKKEEAEKCKKQLLAFTPSATFAGGRKQECINQYSNYIVLDVDKLQPEQLQQAFEKIIKITYPKQRMGILIHNQVIFLQIKLNS